MDLGNKILMLRKQANITQEQLAEKLDVTRQTISKWELNETTPDIKQATSLSKVFNVSLDELLDNDINNVLINKISNTEKLAGIVLKALKIFGIVVLALVVIDLISLVLFVIFKQM